MANGTANTQYNSSGPLRMAIQIEEIIFDSDSIKLEDFSYNRKHLLGLCEGIRQRLQIAGTGMSRSEHA
ncbi:MAG: hypothetical protein ACTHLX_00355, partial [Candidatus Binatia bacterium]